VLWLISTENTDYRPMRLSRSLVQQSGSLSNGLSMRTEDLGVCRTLFVTRVPDSDTRASPVHHQLSEINLRSCTHVFRCLDELSVLQCSQS